MRRILAIGLLMLASSAGAALSADNDSKPESCVYASSIVDAAEFLLTEPKVKPAIWRDRFGGDAAFFKIRYGGVSYEEGMSFLKQLGERTQPPVRLNEILYAYSNPEDRAKLFHGKDEPSAVFREAGISGWRAQFLSEGADSLFAAIRKWNLIYEVLPTAEALADIDDQAKVDGARRAKEADLPDFAIWLLSTVNDLRPLIDFFNDGSFDAKDRERYINMALNNNQFDLTFNVEAQPEEIQKAYAKRSRTTLTLPIRQLISLAPEAGMLAPLLNHTGDERIGWAVAASLLLDIDKGHLDPIQDPDKLLVAMAERLDLILGWRKLAPELANVSAYGPAQQNEKIVDVLNEALARQSLGPFIVDGKVSNLPDRPVLITSDFPWDKWVSAALALQAGRSVQAEDSVIASNLFLATGRYDEAVAILKEDGRIPAMRKAHSIMRALDRRCSTLIYHPLPLADPFYRFD